MIKILVTGRTRYLCDQHKKKNANDLYEEEPSNVKKINLLLLL